MNQNDLKRIQDTSGREFDDVINAEGTMQELLKKFGSVSKMASALKMLNSIAPTAAAAGTGMGFLPPHIMAALYGSSITARAGVAHKSQADIWKDLKIINSAERKVGYQNTAGDSASRFAHGTNQIGLSMGQIALAMKALDAGNIYKNNVLPDANILMAMGGMQGIKGAGTIAAGAIGGPQQLGHMVGAIGSKAGASGAAGTPGYLAGLDPTMLGVGVMLAMNMGGTKLNQAMINAGTNKVQKFKADVGYVAFHSSQIEMEYSNMPHISAQIKVLSNLNQLSPSDALLANILMMIESHTSPIAGILEHLRNSELRKDAMGGNAGQNVASDFFGEDGLSALNDQGVGYTKELGLFQKFLKRYAKTSTNFASIIDIVGQVGNTLSGKSSTALFNEFNKRDKDLQADQRFGNKFGISTAFTRIIHTSSAEVLSQAPTFEAKQLSILAGSFELQRYMSHELLSIRRDGLGVSRPGHTGELMKERNIDEQDDLLVTLGRSVDELLGYIPLYHTISGATKMAMAGFDEMVEVLSGRSNMWNSLINGFRDTITDAISMFDSDEGSLRNSLGATIKSDSELAYSYLSRGFIEHMQELIGINKDQAHYLQFLAQTAEYQNSGGSGRASNGRPPRLGSRSRTEAGFLDRYTGDMVTSAEMNRRLQGYSNSLDEQLESVMPNSVFGELIQSVVPESVLRRMNRNSNLRNYEHARRLQAEFGQSMLSGRAFADGGHTGKSDGTNHKDKTGEEIAGIVHKDEFVINKKDLSKSGVAATINNQNLSSGKVPETAAEKINREEAAKTEILANESAIRIPGTLEESVSTEKKILEEIKNTNGLLTANKPKSSFNGLDFGTLATLAAIAGILTNLEKFKTETMDMMKTYLPMIGALGAGLLGAKFLDSINMPNFNKNKFGKTGGLIGPAAPPGAPISLADKMKSMAGTTKTGLNNGLNAGNAAIKSGLSKAGNAALKGGIPALIAGAAISYALQPDTVKNADGTERAVGFWEKMSNVGTDLLDNSGSVIGGLLGASLGAMTPVPGGMMIGGIAGALLGDYIQDKITDWWDNYEKAKPGEKQASPMEKVEKLLLTNVGMLLGAGLGGVLGFAAGGPIGGIAGTVLGGILGDKIQTKVMEISDSITKNGLFSKDVGKNLVEMAGLSVGAIAGRKVGALAGAPFGPIGMLLGGIVGGMIGESLLTVGGKLLDIINRDTDAPLVSQDKNKQIDAKIAMDKAKLKIDTLQTSRDKSVSGKDSFITGRKKAGKTEAEALSDYNKILNGWDNNLSLAKNEWNSAQDNYALATGGLTSKDKDLHKRGLLRDSFESENIFATKYVRETGTLGGNAKAFQQLNDGGMGAYGASQFDVKSGTLGAFLKHINFNTTGLNTEELAVINVIKKGGRTLTKREREIFMGSDKIQAQVSNREKQDNFANLRFNGILKNHKNIKSFYDAPNTNPTHKILKNYMVSQLNYLPKDGIDILNTILKDGEVTKDELLSLPAYMKNATTKRGFNYSGDQMDSVYVEKVNNQFTTENDKIVINSIKQLKDEKNKALLKTEKAKKAEEAKKTAVIQEERRITEAQHKALQTSNAQTQKLLIDQIAATNAQTTALKETMAKNEFEMIWAQHCSERYNAGSVMPQVALY